MLIKGSFFVRSLFVLWIVNVFYCILDRFCAIFSWTVKLKGLSKTYQCCLFLRVYERSTKLYQFSKTIFIVRLRFCNIWRDNFTLRCFIFHNRVVWNTVFTFIFLYKGTNLRNCDMRTVAIGANRVIVFVWTIVSKMFLWAYWTFL